MIVNESSLSLREKEKNVLVADFPRSQIVNLEVSDIKIVRILLIDESTITGKNDNIAIEFSEKKSLHSFLMDLKLKKYRWALSLSLLLPLQ